jgi:hypothetical protein
MNLGHRNHTGRAIPKGRALWRRATLLAALVGIGVGWSGEARAFMGYPLIVDAWLGTPGLDEKFEPPTGCQLCHVSPAGGTAELRPFGNLMVASYGIPTTAEQDAVLMAALADLKSVNPALYADMQQSKDPNDDPALTAQALPQPDYGCSAPGTRRVGGATWPWIALGIASLVAARRARRKPRPQRSQYPCCG